MSSTNTIAPRRVRTPASGLSLRSPWWLVAFIVGGWTVLGLVAAVIAAGR